MAETGAPFWDIVWGRRQAGSLDRDFPEARKELGAIHRRGLFVQKGKAIAVDKLADELKTPACCLRTQTLPRWWKG